jgi:hypothetical protein
MEGEKGGNFAQLLTEAIYAIKRREGKQIGVIQDELMYAIGRDSGNPIEYWRKGNIPSDQNEFVELSRTLVKRGSLSQEWLTSFWECTNFIGLQEITTETFSDQPEIHSRSKPYLFLIGREEHISEVIACLRDSNKRSIVAIDGMGGIGKTALALEIAARSMANKIFDAVVWITDEGQFEKSEVSENVSLEMIYNKIGQSLGHREFSSLSFSEKNKRLKAALGRGKFLIVVDNLERAIDDQEKIVVGLHEILGKHSKALVMSRQRFLQDVYHVHLQGLVGQDATDFLQQEFDTRGIKRVNEKNADDVFQGLAAKSGGSPLAMKLIVGQLNYQDLTLVLTRLQNVQLVNQNAFDEYAKFYQHIFLPSWTLLTMDGKKLLVSMSHFTSGHGGTFDAIRATSGLSTSKVAGKIDELWRLAFVEIGDSTLTQTRYYLHALTQYFVLSDIVKMI